MLALIKDGEVILQVSEWGRIELDGKVIMPAMEGDLHDGYSLKSIHPADPVPEGYKVIDTTVEIIEGEPKYIHTLETFKRDITHEDVDGERDLRIASGFIFNGARYQSRPEDRENIMGASLAALAYLSSQKPPEDNTEDVAEENEDSDEPLSEEGNEDLEESVPDTEFGEEEASKYRWHGGDTDFTWIAEDNSLVPMDAQTMFAFGQAAMAHKQALIFAARALKDMPEIPEDFRDDKYWIT